MSNQDPASSPMEELQVSGRPPRTGAGSARRQLGGFVAAAVAVAAVGAGVWAWQAWAAQGPQPAEALPGNTLAYLAVDLDPPGGQKVAAFNALRKFPSLKQELGLDSVDELRGSVVEELSTESGCDLDYDADVKPWIGDRAALALVPRERPELVVVLQVEDADRARAGLDAARTGCKDADFGYAIDGEWALLARSTEVAAEALADAGRGHLGDDREFRALTEAAGKPGLVTMYAAPEAGSALLDTIERDPFVVWSALSFVNGGFDPMSFVVGGMGMFLVTTEGFEEEIAAGSSPRELTPEQQSAQARLDKQFERFDELTERERKQLIREQNELMAEIYGIELPDEGGFAEGDFAVEEEFPEGVVEEGYVQEEFAEEDFEGEDFEGEGFEAECSGEDCLEAFPAPELPAGLRDSLEDFTGLGGVARFEDGGLEVEVVADSLEGTYADLYAGTAGDDLVSVLPGDTAIAFGAGFSDGWVDKLMGQLGGQFPFTQRSETETIEAFEKATGLDVPGDLEDLGGEAVTVAAGSGFSPDILGEDPAEVAVAVRISGDPDRIETALAKLRTRLGADGASLLLSRRAGDDVVVGPNADYLEHLAGGGEDLGDTDRFRKVTPRAEDATAVYFLDFDAGDWLAKLAESGGDRADAEPLDSLGMTVTRDEGEQRILLRLGFED